MIQADKANGSGWTILFICWIIATVSALGSLFFSEIMKFAPCVLCWYQRICLFPLVFTFSVGLFSFDKSVVKFSMPMAIAGWFVALYHNLLYTGIIPESIQPCSRGVSCTEDYIKLFGIFSIPMLSIMAFSAIVVLLFILKRRLPE